MTLMQCHDIPLVYDTCAKFEEDPFTKAKDIVGTMCVTTHGRKDWQLTEKIIHFIYHVL